MEKFAIGLAVGGLCGALLVANNYKMRTLIKKGQEEVLAKFDCMVDEKIKAMEKGAEELKEQVQETTENVKEGVKGFLKKKKDN